ncbi:peptide chain release factor N(5)-glutamine methyltransferase [Epilithonimonas xixisoli]|uniref:peptide chain release factor N(5)-glutamine methyltransferase n=1 Tax=Epilithonimonas xixisoli TaxID=1476462 RepID=A0A4V3H2F0_9FLAO|nr:peptide chain release factor N(5)-glutamine methyltransferase [Epilithonimonas xixisoli]TDX83187.1 release factor glutamine methyltransferase [Epilithonimonas xixisoli]
MTIFQIKIFFQDELSKIYSKSEIEELFSIFCEYFLNLNKIELRHNLDKNLSESDSNQLSKAISELKTGKPFQQILGETEFYGMKFFVNEHVLIPRPETEELLELAIRKIQEKIKKNRISNNELREPQPDNSETLKPSNPQTLLLSHSPTKILDIGTGSGIIPIVLKKYFPDAEVTAIDISNDALEVARRNANFHQTEINFINKDYLNEIFDSAQTDKEIYDIIISNPPYIGIEENPEIEVSVKDFEPNLALFSPTSDALIFYRKIAEDCKNHLAENGFLFLEINQKLGLETFELYKDGFSEVELLKDISGNDRMIFGRK